MATLHKFERHSSHKADDDFTALLWDSKARIRVVYEFRQWYKLDSVAVVEESCYAMKGGSPQIKRRRRCERNFPGSRGQECSGVVAAYD